ncbi:rhomboid family intramembrane serine protease [Henriciella sp.]|uniref:rhomboid family intramembrane serine protease n=1 Tax=Henriciella sp. TaxID=1968823 RepID=UPI0026055C32|nr:rhomboid family intramembrane serine protease [Henriciella sp.]
MTLGDDAALFVLQQAQPLTRLALPHICRVYRYDPSQDLRPREPVFNRFPAIVLALTAVIIGTSIIQFMADPYLENWMFAAGAILTGPEFADVTRPFGDFPPLILHVLLHGGFFHLAMNMTAMIAFGPPIAMAFGRGGKGAVGFLVFFAGAAIAGALAQIAWGEFMNRSEIVIGASSALSGFLPAVGWLQGGFKQAVRMSMPWLVINLVIAVVGNMLIAATFGMQLAWMAHIGGLAGGFVLFPLMLRFFNPALAERLRHI